MTAASDVFLISWREGVLRCSVWVFLAFCLIVIAAFGVWMKDDR